MISMPLRLAPPPAADATPPGSRLALAVRAGSGDAYLVDAVAGDALVRLRAEWVALADRCLEPNAFMDPDVCLPLAAYAGPGKLLIVLAAWKLGGPEPRLVAVCPMLDAGMPFGRLVTTWAHELLGLSAPLLDRDCADPALEAVLDWLARFRPRSGAWRVARLVEDGPTARLLAAVAARTARPLQTIGLGRRAILRDPLTGPAGFTALPTRKAKELRRQRKRLAEVGRLAYSSATAGPALETALRAFLELEARGWKGRRGTAMLGRPEQAAFARDAVRGMASRGLCRIDSLTLEGEAIAAGILLSSGGRDFFWKTAFDERFAWASPGVQFALELTDRQRRPGGADTTDSCALPDHPMIDRLWPGRIGTAAVLIGIAPNARRRFAAAAALERLRLAARARLKRLATVLRRR